MTSAELHGLISDAVAKQRLEGKDPQIVFVHRDDVWGLVEYVRGPITDPYYMLDLGCNVMIDGVRVCHVMPGHALVLTTLDIEMHGRNGNVR